MLTPQPVLQHGQQVPAVRKQSTRGGWCALGWPAGSQALELPRNFAEPRRLQTARLLLLACVSLAVAVAAEAAPPAPAQVGYLRYAAEPADKWRLDTAVATFRRGAVAVDLVGAVHVGDRGYYKALNARFRGYDRVLFELIKPEEFDMRQFSRSQGAVSGLQRVIKDLLQLEFQLDHIDYRARNFVHADMDSDRLGERLRQHAGDILGSLLVWSVGDAARLQHADGSMRWTAWELVQALTDPDSPRALKRLLARELSEMDIGLGDVGGFGFGSVLINERNGVAVQVLQRTLSNKKLKKIAIFYGAAHLPDLAARLQGLGFSPGPVSWLRAWDLAAARSK